MVELVGVVGWHTSIYYVQSKGNMCLKPGRMIRRRKKTAKIRGLANVTMVG